MAAKHPDGDWGVIDSRLPWLQFGGYEGGGSFTMNWNDSQSGTVHSRAFSADGDDVGSSDVAKIANLEEFFKGMGQQFVEITLGNLQGDAAVLRGWESQTAFAQVSRGDALAGFNIEQRARAQGLVLGSDPDGSNARSGQMAVRIADVTKNQETPAIQFRGGKWHDRVSETFQTQPDNDSNREMMR